MNKDKTRKIRRLFYDIEVSHNVVLAFRAGYDQHINPESIIKERKVICIGYLWEGEKKATVLRWDKNQDDKALLKKFTEIANEADEIVEFNGDRYDNPFVRTRCVINGLPPLPTWKTIDVYQWAKRHYLFNSNKLNYICEVLGFGGKMKTDYKLWHDILLKSCPIALDKICRYCAKDVLLLQKAYDRLKFCVKPKTHAGVFNGLDKWTCPGDGSTNVRINKKRVTSNGTVQYTLQCQDCGRYYTVSATAYSAFLEAKKKKPL